MQRERDRGRDGVSDDRVLPQPDRPAGALQRHRPRVRPHLVPHGGGQQRAAVRLDGRRVQQLHEPLQLGQQVSRRCPTGAGDPGTYIVYALSGDEAADHDARRPDPRSSSCARRSTTSRASGSCCCASTSLGPERFDPAFREYIRRWAYKHPTPADFFRTIEDGLGEDLSWFWRSWFYTTERSTRRWTRCVVRHRGGGVPDTICGTRGDADAGRAGSSP